MNIRRNDDIPEPPETLEEHLEHLEEALDTTAQAMLESDALIEEIQTQDDIKDHLLTGETVSIEVDKAVFLQAMDTLEKSLDGAHDPLTFYSKVLAFTTLIQEEPEFMEEVMMDTLEEYQGSQEVRKGFH